MADDLTDRDLEITARAELSLRRMVADERLDAMSFQFMAIGEDERAQTVPFVAVSRLMAEGVGFAGEGDLVGAAGTWLLGQLRPPATFSEIFTIDFEGNSLLMSHMGEANVAMARADRKVPLVARPQPITRTRGRQLVLVTSLEPGPATLFALTLGPKGRWRLISSRMRIVDGEVVFRPGRAAFQDRTGGRCPAVAHRVCQSGGAASQCDLASATPPGELPPPPDCSMPSMSFFRVG